MRIIAGEHRGRRIVAPPGDSTRPMLDRVRESLFATLGNLVEDARVLDLFCGGGSLGLEALSRGACAARMVERDPDAYAALKKNILALGYERARAVAVRGNALQPSTWVPPDAETARRREPESPAAAGHEGFDLVFFDPPYAMYDDPNKRAKMLEAIDALLARHVRDNGALILHAPMRALESVRLRREVTTDLRAYGSSSLLYVFPNARASPSERASPEGRGP